MSPQFGGFGRSAKTESNPLKLWYLTVLLICGILISAGCIVASHPPSSPPLPSAPLTIASTSLPAATAGSSYSTVLVASGGVTPYGWSATGLPAGLAVGTNTGQISGTPATAGNYTVTASVRDSENSPASASKTFSLTITSTPPPALSVITASLPAGTRGSSYSTVLEASGGATPYSWSATGLPAGLALSTNTGQISGTPSTAGNYTVAASVRDSENSPVSASKTFSLTITSTPPPALSVTTASLPAGTQGSSYSTGLAASGGIAPYSWSATGLPAGLSLNSGTGQISGTPSTAGNYTVTASVRDSENSPASASKTFSLTITSTPPPALSITTTSLPAGTRGSSYSTVLEASGGATPYSWSATGLPAGLALSTNTGQISGTPSTAGNYTVAASVRDSENSPVSVSKTFSLTITSTPPPALSVTTASLPAGTRGSSYSTVLEASGGATPYSWSATGLPAGLALSTNTGQISGTPSTAGNYTVAASVRDSENSPVSVSKTFSLTITSTPPPALSVTTASLPAGTRGSSYSTVLEASGGATPYSWSATGLPAGLALSTNTGQISGTPSTAGNYTVAASVRDSENSPVSASKTFSLTITSTPPPALSVTTASLPAGTQGSSYSTGLAASGGIAPYSWSATGLPAGLSLNSGTGQISGTPSTAGNYTVTASVRDSENSPASASKTFSLTITSTPPPALSITTTSLPAGTRGSSYSTVLEASGGATPYSWSATGLPAGLALSTNTGQISGTPSTAGNYTVAASVRDSENSPVSVSKTFSLTITSTPP